MRLSRIGVHHGPTGLPDVSGEALSTLGSRADAFLEEADPESDDQRRAIRLRQVNEPVGGAHERGCAGDDRVQQLARLEVVHQRQGRLVEGRQVRVPRPIAALIVCVRRLRQVEGGIGSRYEVVLGPRVVRIARGTDRDRNPRLVLRGRQAIDDTPDSVRDIVGGCPAGTRQDHGEFVAAIAVRPVVTARGR